MGKTPVTIIHTTLYKGHLVIARTVLMNEDECDQDKALER